MPATVATARSPLEMIVSGEDHVIPLIQVIVRFQGSHFFRLRKDGLGVVQFIREPGNGLETRAAKAPGLDAIRRQPVQDVIRHEDFMAPAGSLVEMALGHAALVVTAAPRALLITPQTRAWRLRYRRFVVSSLCFHEIDFVQAEGTVMVDKTTTCSGCFE